MNYQIEAFREATSEAAKSTAQHFGHIIPMISVLSLDHSIESLPIPDKFFQSDATKGVLATKVIPELLAELRSKGKQPLCLAIVMDAYLTEVKTDKENISMKEALKLKEKMKHTRIEVLNISYHSEEGDSSDIIPYQRTKEGKLIFQEARPAANMDKHSRFANFFKKQ